jgi:hypothetical protein
MHDVLATLRASVRAHVMAIAAACSRGRLWRAARLDRLGEQRADGASGDARSLRDLRSSHRAILQHVEHLGLVLTALRAPARLRSSRRGARGRCPRALAWLAVAASRAHTRSHPTFQAGQRVPQTLKLLAEPMMLIELVFDGLDARLDLLGNRADASAPPARHSWLGSRLVCSRRPFQARPRCAISRDERASPPGRQRRLLRTVGVAQRCAQGGMAAAAEQCVCGGGAVDRRRGPLRLRRRLGGSFH